MRPKGLTIAKMVAKVSVLTDTAVGKRSDIVGIIAQSAKAGGIEYGLDTDDLVAEKVGWVREAAGQRSLNLSLPC